MKRVLFFTLVLIVSAQAFAQKKVTELPAKHEEGVLLPETNGFYYTLPKTSFKIDVTVTRTTEIKGYYAEYAEKLLGLNNIITANKTHYKLHDVKISSFETPDTSRLFLVELSKNQVKESYLTKLYSKIPLQEEEIVFTEEYKNMTTKLPDFFKNYSELTYIEEEDTYMVKQLVDSIVTEIPVNTTKKVTKTVAQKAQEAADFIIQIRKDRYNLTSGVQEVAYSKEALNLMIDELNSWEKNYLDLFTGITLEDEEHYIIIVTPDESGAQTVHLFSMSADGGFSLKADAKNAGNNYQLVIEPQVTNEKRVKFLAEKSQEEKYVPNSGYRIRKAVPAKVALQQNKQTVHTWGLFPVFQFGVVETLPANQDNFEIEKFAVIF